VHSRDRGICGGLRVLLLCSTTPHQRLPHYPFCARLGSLKASTCSTSAVLGNVLLLLMMMMILGARRGHAHATQAKGHRRGDGGHAHLCLAQARVGGGGLQGRAQRGSVGSRVIGDSCWRVGELLLLLGVRAVEANACPASTACSILRSCGGAALLLAFVPGAYKQQREQTSADKHKHSFWRIKCEPASKQQRVHLQHWQLAQTQQK